jgi:hypothetical protein
MALAKGHVGAEGARAVGEYTGAVPDCLKPRAADRGLRQGITGTPRSTWPLCPSTRRRSSMITTLAPRFSIEPRLALAIATTESI